MRKGAICIRTLVARFCFEISCRCVKKTIKDRNWLGECVSVLMSLPRAYEDPQEPGALGGVQPFAQAHKLKTPQAQRILQSVLSYTLHKPRRTRFPTTPTLVFDRDEQWQMDLVDGIRGTNIC